MLSTHNFHNFHFAPVAHPPFLPLPFFQLYAPEEHVTHCIRYFTSHLSNDNNNSHVARSMFTTTSGPNIRSQTGLLHVVWKNTFQSLTSCFTIHDLLYIHNEILHRLAVGEESKETHSMSPFLIAICRGVFESEFS